MINFKAIGQRVKNARKKMGYTQETLAEMLDISTEHLSRIERGAYRPSLGLIEKMSSILETDEGTLMFGSAINTKRNQELIKKIECLSEDKKEALSMIIDLIDG